MIDFGSGDRLTVAECFDEENDELAFTSNGGIGFLKEHEVRSLHAFLGSLLEGSGSTPQKRKIVQISAIGPADGYDSGEVAALCNDGSIWVTPVAGNFGWERLLDIPQDDELNKARNDARAELKD